MNVTRLILPALMLALAPAALAQPAPMLTQVLDDAKAIERFAQMSKRGDLPRDVIRRIVDEDMDLLRGKRVDGTYQYATYERVEANRFGDDFSVQPAADNEKLTHIEVRGDFVYRLIVTVPSRRMLVTKNRRVYVDHVDIEYIPQTSSVSKTQSIQVATWLEPGETKTFDLPDVARQTTTRAWMRADKKAGYANVTLTLLQARVTDNADSPYADIVASEKALLRAVRNEDTSSVRVLAGRIRMSMPSTGAGTPAAASIDVSGPPSSIGARPVAPTATQTTTAAPAPTATMTPDALQELQQIEDLLTGTESERRSGVDRLHQLIRRMRK
jgi:hypothetical protein